MKKKRPEKGVELRRVAEGRARQPLCKAGPSTGGARGRAMGRPNTRGFGRVVLSKENPKNIARVSWYVDDPSQIQNNKGL